jgi:hypothetical protein
MYVHKKRKKKEEKGKLWWFGVHDYLRQGDIHRFTVWLAVINNLERKKKRKREEGYHPRFFSNQPSSIKGQCLSVYKRSLFKLYILIVPLYFFSIP